MKFHLLIFLLIVLVFRTGMLRAGPSDDVELSISVYQTNTRAALEILSRVYSGDADSLNLVKTILTERQSHRLYAEFLSHSPFTPVLADEVLSMDLALQDLPRLNSDLDKYLNIFPAARFVQKHGPTLSKLTNAPFVLLEGRYRPETWSLVKTSFLRSSTVIPLDVFLAGRPGLIPAQEIQNYLAESWPVRHRNILPILKANGLENDPVFRPIRAFSSHVLGDFESIVREYSGKAPSSSTAENDARSYGIDSSFIFLVAAFRTGRYREALAVTRVTDSNQVKLPEYRFLCHLGLNDPVSARREAESDRGANAFFFRALLDMLENPSNGMDRLVPYLEKRDPDQDYVPESLLLMTARTRGPEVLSRTAGALRKPIVFKPADHLPDMPLFSVYAGHDSVSPSGYSPLLKSVSLFRSADRHQTGDKAARRSIYLSVIRDTNASPFLRSLSSYRLRGLD